MLHKGTCWMQTYCLFLSSTFNEINDWILRPLPCLLIGCGLILDFWNILVQGMQLDQELCIWLEDFQVSSDKNICIWIFPLFLFFLGLVGAIMLKPRTGFKGQNARITMGNAKMSLAGLFMIWWGTQAFNSGRYVAVRIIHIPKNIHISYT